MVTRRGTLQARTRVLARAVDRPLLFTVRVLPLWTVAGAPPDAQKPKKRILVAEDDDSIAVMLLKMLETRYQVHRVRNGAEALAVAEQFKPNAVLLDVMMPGLDGYATAQRLRLLPNMKNVSLIFLTAKGGAMDVVKGIQAGARFYVTKPFKMDDLLAKVRKAVGE